MQGEGLLNHVGFVRWAWAVSLRWLGILKLAVFQDALRLQRLTIH